MKKLVALAFGLVVLAGCVQEEEFVMETDVSEANRATECPVDVSEADRANFPACN